MNFLQKIQSVFKAKKADDRLATAIERLTAERTIASKQTGYKTRTFAASKHIKDWKDAIDEATTPPYYRKKDLCEILEQIKYDAQILAQLQTRKNGTLAEKFILDASPETQRLTKQIINTILDSVFYWASACEVSKDYFFVVSPEYLCAEKNELSIGYDKGIPFELFEDLLVFENPYKHLGVLAFASQYAIYKRFSLSDWSRHGELFGMPFLSLRTPISDTEELRKRHKALSEFGSNAYVILDTDEILEAIDTKSVANPYEMYLQMIKFCDEQISKIMVGQVATADQKAFVGSAEVQERILDWYIEADMMLVAETMNVKVIPFLAKKGLVGNSAVFEWEYFKRKQDASATLSDQKKSASKEEKTTSNPSLKGGEEKKTPSNSPKGENKEELHFHEHAHDYESFLSSLKKKA